MPDHGSDETSGIFYVLRVTKLPYMKFISSYSRSLEMVVYICMKAKSLVNLINDSMMDRSQLISRLKDQSIIHDFVVIGGGATGLGVAVDARGSFRAVGFR